MCLRHPRLCSLRTGILAIPPPDLLPSRLLKRYVAYARRFCHPYLTEPVSGRRAASANRY